MGRGLAILAIFAAVIGAYVYWGPLHLSVNSGKTAPTSTSDTAVRDTGAHEVSPTIATDRKAESTSTEVQPRDAVLAVPPPAPATPLGALPERIIPGFPPTPQTYLTSDKMASVIKQSRHLCAQGQSVEARDLLSGAYLANRLSKEQRLRLAGELEPLCQEILRSHAVLNDGELYEVQPGDMLGKIAKPFHVPPEFIRKINGLKSARSIRPRQTLKLVQGPFDVLVELSEFELTVLNRSKFVRRFPIGIGKADTPTPAGLYTVNTKLPDPIYYAPGAPPVPARDPNNPLGSRWIDIGLGYGIHGTVESETIGQMASRGCIRLHNKDVEELYDMVAEGSRVLVRP